MCKNVLAQPCIQRRRVKQLLLSRNVFELSPTSSIGATLPSCTLLFNLFKMAANKSSRKRGVTGHKEGKCQQSKEGKLKGFKMALNKRSRNDDVTGHQPGGAGR